MEFQSSNSVLYQKILEKWTSIQQIKSRSDYRSMEATLSSYIKNFQNSNLNNEYLDFHEKFINNKFPDYILNDVIDILHDKDQENIPLMKREEKRDSFIKQLYGCLHYTHVFKPLLENEKKEPFQFYRNRTETIFATKQDMDEAKQILMIDEKNNEKILEMFNKSSNVEAFSQDLFKRYPYITAVLTFSYQNETFLLLYTFKKEASVNKRYILFYSFTLNNEDNLASNHTTRPTSPKPNFDPYPSDNFDELSANFTEMIKNSIFNPNLLD